MVLIATYTLIIFILNMKIATGTQFFEIKINIRNDIATV